LKKRLVDPPFSTAALGRGLAGRGGIGLNLLVADVAAATRFARDVLGVEIEYEDADFAMLRWLQSQWLVHADHTYERHPLTERLRGAPVRGAGAELRLYGVNPDVAESQARKSGFVVLAAAADKPHGMREAYLLDADGYVWVPSVPAGS
jgi:catechol 2,3-dioxygenase-like lactoylglutathione lyase family enzyme